MDFEELKQKAIETAEIIADKSVEVAKNVAEQAKILAKKAKLFAEMAAEKEKLRANYEALGTLYFELYADDPCDGLEQAIEDVKLAKEKIEAIGGKVEVK